jgi:hypothetical protein
MSIGKNILAPSITPPRIQRLKDEAEAASSLNFSSRPQTFICAYENGIDILTGQPAKRDHKISLAPWDLIVVKVHKG